MGLFSAATTTFDCTCIDELVHKDFTAVVDLTALYIIRLLSPVVPNIVVTS